METPKSKKPRCKCIVDNEGTKCRAKLSLVDQECKCGIKFCGKHRLPENHNCSFDFKEEGRRILMKNNPPIVPIKIIKV
jgi:predicted nucleic acid binding AN1-type Zn finger protein